MGTFSRWVDDRWGWRTSDSFTCSDTCMILVLESFPLRSDTMCSFRIVDQINNNELDGLNSRSSRKENSSDLSYNWMPFVRHIWRVWREKEKWLWRVTSHEYKISERSTMVKVCVPMMMDRCAPPGAMWRCCWIHTHTTQSSMTRTPWILTAMQRCSWRGSSTCSSRTTSQLKRKQWWKSKVPIVSYFSLGACSCVFSFWEMNRTFEPLAGCVSWKDFVVCLFLWNFPFFWNLFLDLS